MALVSNPHSAYSPRLPWLGGIAGLLVGGAILYFWPQWNRTWLSLVPVYVGGDFVYNLRPRLLTKVSR